MTHSTARDAHPAPLSAAPSSAPARGAITVAGDGDGDGDGSGAVIRMSGEVDHSLREQASGVMTEVLRLDGPVVIDAAECTFLDSSGLAFVLQVMAIGADDGRSVVLQDPPPHVVDLLDVAGLRDRVPVQRTAGREAEHDDGEPGGLAGGLSPDVVASLTATDLEADLVAPVSP